MTDNPTSINVDQFFPHPPERVWRVLTTSELMARWLMPNDFKPELGHVFTFTSKPVPGKDFSGTGRSEVLAIEEPTLLRISWQDAWKPDGPVTFVTLRPCSRSWATAGVASSNAVSVPCSTRSPRGVT